MELHPELRSAIDAGVHGQLVTLGRDDDELLVAHLGSGQKMCNYAVKFPPMDNPPPGRVLHITVDRITGNGPRVF